MKIHLQRDKQMICRLPLQSEKMRVVIKRVSIVLLIVNVLTGCSGSMPKLGINNGQLMPCPKTPNCVSTQATDEKHFIEPIIFAGTLEEAKNRLLNILKAWNRTKILIIQENYIRAEFKSKIFRFVDDAEFYFLPEKSETVTIHIRSASRVGYSDLGVNRKRIEQIRATFKTY